MRSIAPHQRRCAYAVEMPNLKEPVLDLKRKDWYREHLHEVYRPVGPHLLMTCQLTPNTPLFEIEHSRGVLFAWKGFSRGVTTNSEYGIAEWDCPEMHERAMVAGKAGVPWLLHLQDKTENPLDGEVSALRRAMPLIEKHSDVIWCLEHATCSETIAYILYLRSRGFRITTTLTLHHATKCVDDVRGDPQNKVQPPIQTAKNRDAVLEATLSAKFLKGRDCAAHPAELKTLDWDQAPSGIWTPDEVDIPLTYQIFREHGGKNWLERYIRFVSENSYEFYGGSILPRRILPPIRLVREDWEVEVVTSPIVVVPFMNGKVIKYRLAA